jgi:hypothetical protein
VTPLEWAAIAVLALATFVWWAVSLPPPSTWRPPKDRVAELTRPAVLTPTPGVRALHGGETVWLVFWGARLERCEAFASRSLAIAFSRSFAGAIVEFRKVHGEQGPP